mgnify:CR=1 FL=1
MLPILPLIIGAAAGAAATQLVRTKAVQQGLKKAGSQIRQAGDTLKQKASDGLDTVRETGAEMRRKVADKLHRRSAAHAGDADSSSQAGGASPKSTRRTTTTREASEETPAPRRRPRKRPQTLKTEQAAASATPSTESGSNDDAGQH